MVDAADPRERDYIGTLYILYIERFWLSYEMSIGEEITMYPIRRTGLY